MRSAANQRFPASNNFPIWLASRDSSSRPTGIRPSQGSDFAVRPDGLRFMSQRPATFGQLLSRLMSPCAMASQHHGPVIASATEVAPAGTGSESPQWVILHSITDSDVQLIHPRPMAASELAINDRRFMVDAIPVPKLAGALVSKAFGEAKSSSPGFRLRLNPSSVLNKPSAAAERAGESSIPPIESDSCIARLLDA